MKQIFSILIVILVIGFVVVQLFALKSHYNIETHAFTVKEKYGTFEIRTYEKALFTSVKLPNNGFKDVASNGFSVLAGYIFGGNDKKEKIAMTSPVKMSIQDSMTMLFMVPHKFKKETLPLPNDSNIEFKEEAEKTVAAIGFGGWANAKKIDRYKKNLRAALDAKDIPYNNQFFFLGYNAPYEVFNRKNEIIVELNNEN
jgi:hypothetical protein